MASRERLGGCLDDRRWKERVLDQTYAGVNELAAAGRYPFPTGPDGSQLRNGLQGPEYMRRMRIRVQRAGARILDHSPVTELLTDPSGAPAGARGWRRQAGETYRVRAGAVAVATGGCSFLSGALGCNVNTDDGALLAAETGAELSGMEFSNAYGIAPEGTSVTKTAFYSFATFYRADGTVLESAASQGGRSVIARTLLHEKVYCRIDRADDQARRAMRLAQPNFFLPFDRLGIDPFTERFAITLLAEGTVRGTGGIRITGDDCSTTVPGLYAAGDATTRELICGGFTGGGSHNAAWAISSGTWAGKGAARHALSLGFRAATRRLQPTGGTGLRPTGTPGSEGAHRDVIASVQAEVLPYDRNYRRHGNTLAASLTALNAIWREARATLHASGADVVRAREAAAMAAHARWMYASALARTESRGMARRLDFPEQDPLQRHRIVSGGLDEVWSRPEPVPVPARLPTGPAAVPEAAW
ncbi:FAD-binding protein [Streptomyces sp. NPDC047028]|uniref:FAD-binding protein n=1 Tax=Streptomyces sp. NPDC047028 TaxID=3155793 RepID=UPI00340E3ED2